MKTHQDIDARSLALHRLVAHKLRQDPARLEDVKATLARWRQTVCPATQPYLREWEQLVDQGLERCLAVAVEESEHATALRQSSPFTRVLSHAERFRFLKTWRGDHDEAALTASSLAPCFANGWPRCPSSLSAYKPCSPR